MNKEIVPVEERKNQVVAGLFSIFLWPLGLHCFYLRELVGGILNIVVFLGLNLQIILVATRFLDKFSFINQQKLLAWSCLGISIMELVSVIYGLRILLMSEDKFHQEYK